MLHHQPPSHIHYAYTLIIIITKFLSFYVYIYICFHTISIPVFSSHSGSRFHLFCCCFSMVVLFFLPFLLVTINYCILRIHIFLYAFFWSWLDFRSLYLRLDYINKTIIFVITNALKSYRRSHSDRWTQFNFFFFLFVTKEKRIETDN